MLGGTGLIGSQVVQKLTAAGHEAVPAALSTGIDLITWKGLDQAPEGAEVVINLSNSPTFDEASLDFFRTSMNNLLAAGESAGVRTSSSSSYGTTSRPAGDRPGRKERSGILVVIMAG
jgi:uncharacterized protein YbjT (DUF2867 family)